MIDTDAELIAEAHKVAALYGNDWGVLILKMAEALKRHNAREQSLPRDVADLIARARGAARGMGAQDLLTALADALAHHSAPLPEAVAGLVSVIEEFLDDADHFELVDGSAVDITPADNALGGLTSLLASQEREIERTRRKFELATRGLTQRAEAAEARIDHYVKATLASNDMVVAAEARVRQLENEFALERSLMIAERDAIRAALRWTLPFAEDGVRQLRKSPSSHGEDLAKARALAKEPADAKR